MSEFDDAIAAEQAAWKARRLADPVGVPTEETYPYQHPIVPQQETAIRATPGAAPLFGWQVVTRLISGDWYWGVIKGKLYDTQKNGAAEITVTGFLTDSTDPGDAGWSAIGTAPAKIWLEGAYAVGGWPAYDSVYINSTDYDGGKLEYATTTDGDGNTVYVQTFFRRKLGEVPAYDGSGVPELITEGLGILYLENGGDVARDSGAANPFPTPVIFPQA